ncbi:MAG: ABC transporter ATP-binding protein [Christensenellales bacterium]|jgi:ATP-binding cassette subfamily B multidrug efflux pump
MPYIKKTVLKYRKQIFLGQFFKLIEAILELMMPVAMASVIDKGIALGDKSHIFRNVGIMFLLAFVGVCCAMVCQVVATKTSVGMSGEMRREAFEKINSLSAQDLDSIGTNSLVTRMTIDINNLQDAMAMLIRLVIRSPFIMIGSIIMAIILDVKLSLVLLITTPLVSIIMFIILRAVAPKFSALQKSLDLLSRKVNETISGIRVIRAFSREESLVDSFDESSKFYADFALNTGKITSLLSPIVSLCLNMAIIAVLMLGAKRVQLGKIELGIVIAFIEYLIQIFLQTAVVANLVLIYTRAYASAKRVEELMDTKPSVSDKFGIKKGDFIPKGNTPLISFKNVCITYPDGKPALQDISFSLNKGESLGIIGGTGSGKSTLVSLILRFYDTTKGVVKFCGEDIKNIPIEELRKRISFVPQRVSLFKGSVEQNLKLGNNNASKKDMEDALNIAQADFVYELPGGLKYNIEESGRNLSGGQRQRLTIARAILKPFEVIILDDSFSALDLSTESRLRRALKKSLGDRSCIVVSQRISTIMHADNIIVLDNGVCVGMGKHDYLLKHCEIYKELYITQTAGAEYA